MRYPVSTIIEQAAVLSPDIIGIATTGSKMTVLYVSPALKTILGYDPELVIGKGTYEAIPSRVLKRERTVGPDGIVTRHVVVLTVCADGSEKLMDWTAREIPNQGVMLTIGREMTVEPFEPFHPCVEHCFHEQADKGIEMCCWCGAWYSSQSSRPRLHVIRRSEPSSGAPASEDESRGLELEEV